MAARALGAGALEQSLDPFAGLAVRIGWQRGKIVLADVAGHVAPRPPAKDEDIDQELVPNRLAPCTETQAHSPAA